MPKLIRIKLGQNNIVAGPNLVIQSGGIAELPEDKANQMIEQGVAYACDKLGNKIEPAKAKAAEEAKAKAAPETATQPPGETATQPKPAAGAKPKK